MDETEDAKRHPQGFVEITLGPMGASEEEIARHLLAQAELAHKPEWNQILELGPVQYNSMSPVRRIARAKVFFVDQPDEPNPADQRG